MTPFRELVRISGFSGPVDELFSVSAYHATRICHRRLYLGIDRVHKAEDLVGFISLSISLHVCSQTDCFPLPGTVVAWTVHDWDLAVVERLVEAQCSASVGVRTAGELRAALVPVMVDPTQNSCQQHAAHLNSLLLTLRVLDMP